MKIVQSATKNYMVADKNRYVFRNLSIEMEPNTCLALMGPNGCGKSSLLHVLLGLQTLNEGEVCIKLHSRDLLGAVLQDYRKQLLPWGSVEKNILLPFGGENSIEIKPIEVLTWVNKFFEKLNYKISFSELIKNLSGGQQQAVVLARAMALRSSFFIWDEPTSALDFTRRGLLYQYINCHRQKMGTSVIFVTHDLDEALILADRILIFNERMQILCDESLYKFELSNSFLEKRRAQQIRSRIRSVMIGHSDRN